MLPTLPHDKANHLAYGAAIACAAVLAHSVIAAGIAVAVFAVGKEVYDRVSKKGTPEPLDAVATLAGGALVLLPLIHGGV